MIEKIYLKFKILYIFSLKFFFFYLFYIENGFFSQLNVRYTFYVHIATCCSCSIYYLLYMMHLLIGAKPGLLSPFFSLVKKRLCSPELKHCLNVYSVVL